MRLKLIAVAVAALAPVVAMLAYSEVVARRHRNEEVRANAAQAALQASSEIERIIEGMRSLLVSVTAMPSIQDLDIPNCSKALRSVASRVPNIGTIFVLDPAGNMVCGSADPPAAHFADRDYFKAALETKDFVVGTYTQSRISDVQVLPVVLPIVDSGSVKSVVVTGIRLDWLQTRLTARGVLSGNAVTVADGNGTILARMPYPERFVGTVIPDAFQPLIHSEAPGVLEVTSQDGTERVLGYRPISLPASPLYVSAGFSRNEAFAPVNQSTLITVVAIVGGALLSLIAAVLIGNRFFLTRIQRIADTMERWRKGDMAARTGMGGGDELEAVGASLDGLLDELDYRRRREQSAAEERELLSRELAHRVKNGFALVQAIARQTFHRADPDRYHSFSQRLSGLAQTYDLLLTQNSAASSMREVILNALRAHVDPASSQVTVEGPETVLPAAFALSLSLVVHELATNATKYGSLTADEGRVSIRWTCEGQSVHMNWRESGGPPVVAPESKGFGSLLIERAFPAAARARSAPDYRAQGLVFDLAFELDEPQGDKSERVQ